MIRPTLTTIAFLAGALPVAAEKQVIVSQTEDMERASQLASIRLVLECRKVTASEKTIILKKVGVGAAELNDPAVVLLSNKYKRHLSSDCRSFDKIEVGREMIRVSNAYDIRFNGAPRSQVKLTKEKFAAAAGLIAALNCRHDQGMLQTTKEKTNLLGLGLKKSGIPLGAAMNKNVALAAAGIRPYLDASCEKFIEAKEGKVIQILLRYYESQ
ncbi:hypothetical protein [Synechococcus sp. MIT S9451]|uniref:hypothetical protein n=1 Tax=Synechococcus sp. MIT S9451 TaxID=3082543 RepID=UPI0039B6B987